MRIERKLQYTLTIAHVWIKDAQDRGYDIENESKIFHAVSIADKKGIITKDNAPQWLREMSFGYMRKGPPFPVRITSVDYSGVCEGESMEINHYEGLTWKEFHALGRKRAFTIKPTYILEK